MARAITLLAGMGPWLTVAPGWAQDASWTGAASGDWNTAANWNPATVPTGRATFGPSSTTALSFSNDASVAAVQFGSSAPLYAFSIFGHPFLGGTQFTRVSVTGAGIVSDPANAPSFAVGTFGVLQFFNASSAGNATISAASGPSNASALTFADTSSAGAAKISIGIGAEADFSGSSSAGNATITLSGARSFPSAVLNFHNTASAGNAQIASASGFINFDGNSTAGTATIISAGSPNSSAGVQFLDNASAANATIVNANRLAFVGTAGQANITTNAGGATSFGVSSTAGSATLTSNAGGTLNFFDTSTGGQARLITNANGTVDMSFLAASGLAVGSIEGAGTYFLGSKQFTVGTNNLSTTVTGVIADGGGNATAGGSLVKVGTGTLTLAGTNTYTGATQVSAGTLLVNGAIAASRQTTVGSGATLGGSGTVGPTIVARGGTLAPGPGGGGAGTLRVAGNLAFQSGAAYFVQIAPASPTSSSVTASGTAALAGGVLANFAPGSGVARQYTILHASGLNGAFDSLTTSNIPPGFTPSLGYTGTDALLNISASLGRPFPGGTLPANQANVAAAINGFFNQGGALPAAFTPLFSLSGSALADALAQLSGEGGAIFGPRLAGMQMTGAFLSLMLDPFGGVGMSEGFAAKQALWPDMAQVYAAATPMVGQPPAPQRGWGVWGQAYGGTSMLGGSAVAGTHDISASGYGFAAGADYRLAPDTLMGFALAGGSTHSRLQSGLGESKGDVIQLGVYGSQRFGATYVAAAFAYARHDMTTDRTVTVSGSDSLTAHFPANSFGGRLEAGHRIDTALVGIVPYAALQVQAFNAPSYGESARSGSNSFALAYGAKSITAVRTELGAWLEKAFTLDAASMMVVRTRAAWVHDYSGTPGLAAAFQTLPGASFTVTGAPPVPNSALLSAGGEIRLAGGLAFGARFDAQLANQAHAYAGVGTLRYEW